MNSIIYYTLRAELHTRKGEGKLQSFLFDREYIVKYLGKRGENATYYDPELKLHFENKSALSFAYQVEVKNNLFLLPGTFEKATGFTKSVNYMFDWIQLQVSLQGKIRAIENRDEIKKRWNVLKESLLSNYKGRTVDTYLAEIDSRFEESGFKLKQCQGNIIMRKNEHLPLSAIVEVVFKKDDMAYQWGFVFKRC